MADKDIKVLREQPNGSFKEVVLGDSVEGTIVDKDVRIQGTKLGYRLYLQNIANFDPGEPFVVDGRARIVHGMNFLAGVANFTGASDHCHVGWNASQRSTWQMIQNGPPSDSASNYFTLHTRGKDPIGTVLSPSTLHSIDTRDTITSPTSPLYLAEIKMNWTAAPTALAVGTSVIVQFATGAVGIAAGMFPGTIVSGPTQLSVDINGTPVVLHQYVIRLQGMDPEHWYPQFKGLYLINSTELTNQVFKVFYNFQEIQGTRSSISAYPGVARFANVTINGHDAYDGMSIVLKIGGSTNIIGLPPRDYNGYVRHVIDANQFVISIGNAIGGWFSLLGSATSSADWRIIKGTTDNNHQYTPALQQITFERLPTSDTSTLTTGGNKNVAIGNSAEASGNFSYALGYKAGVFADKSAIVGGENNLILPEANESTIIGGKNNIIPAGITKAVIINGDGTIASESNKTYIPRLVVTEQLEAPSLNTLSGGLPVPSVNLVSATGMETLGGVNPIRSFDVDSKGPGNIISFANYPIVHTEDLTNTQIENGVYVECVILNKKNKKHSKKLTVAPSPWTGQLINGNWIPDPWTYPWPQDFQTRTGEHNYIVTSGSIGNQTHIKHLIKMNRPNHFLVPQASGTDQRSFIHVYQFLNGRFTQKNIKYNTGADTVSVIDTLIPLGGTRGYISKRFGYSSLYRPFRIAFRYIMWDNNAGRIVSGPLSKTVKIWHERFPFFVDHVASTIAQKTVLTLNPVFANGSNINLKCWLE